MSYKLTLLILLFIALILDSTLISLPLVAALCILMYLLYNDLATLIIIFVSGIIIDSLSLQTIGSTSLFLLLTCLVIYIYKNIFELKDMRLVVLFLFLSTYIYALIFGYSSNIFIYLILFALAQSLVYYFTNRSKIPMIHNS